jgi:hypothetical protein
VAGKRFTVRSRDLRWREGRYGKRRRPRRPTRPPTPRLVLDAIIAVVASLVAGGIVFCMAFLLFGSHKVPLHFGYGAILGAVTLGSLWLGPRDRGGRMTAAALALVWILGTSGLYAARDQIHLGPHGHHSPAVVALGREPA